MNARNKGHGILPALVLKMSEMSFKLGGRKVTGPVAVRPCNPKPPELTPELTTTTKPRTQSGTIEVES